MSGFFLDSINIFLTIIFVFLNGYFVAAEFALVKVRPSRLNELSKQNRPFAGTARWLYERQNATLSVCQLGITMASLALGWIGEPALAHLLEPVLLAVGITSEAALHTTAFAVAFTMITSMHIVIGEQVPKIYAIRRPGIVFLWCAFPLKLFYQTFYPFMTVLNGSSNFLLRKLGIKETAHYEPPLSEEEIKASLTQAHETGTLTHQEHELLTAVFEMEETVCREIMVPRGDIEFLDIEQPFADSLTSARRSNHTRFPLCEGSLDHVIGFVHTKDLIGVPPNENFDLNEIARPIRKVPETLPVNRLLGLFQSSRQHIALVVDEHDTIVGVVTLEDVLEELVGEVQDEFDSEMPSIVPDGPNQFIVLGNTLINDLNDELGIHLQPEAVDTLSGYLIERVGVLLRAGQTIELDGIIAEVLEIKGTRATKVRLKLPSDLNMLEE